MEYKDIEYILDTNVWVSSLCLQDTNHKVAQIIIERIPAEQIIPDVVFYEVLTVLKLKIDLEIAFNFMEFVKNNVDITIKLYYENNRTLAELMLDKRFIKLSYVDILLLYLSKEYTIVTFDKELVKAIEIYGGDCKGY